MKMAVPMTSDLGAETQRPVQEFAPHKNAEGGRKWAEWRAKFASSLRSLFTYAVIVTLAFLAFSHREELQRIVSRNLHRIVASRDTNPNSGSLRQNAVSHENEVDQASQ